MKPINDAELAAVSGGLGQYTSDWGVSRWHQQKQLAIANAQRNGASEAGIFASSVVTGWGDIGRQVLGIPRWQPPARP